MQQRWNPKSSSDEDDDRWPRQTEPVLKRQRKLLVVDEEEADDSGGEEVADEDMEVLKPIGEVVRVSGSGGRKINHYKAFDFAGNIYKLGDSVLMSPENETQKPYVAIIKLAYLEDWALLERDHSTSLAGAINDLELSTIRLPITAGARADPGSLKAAISSATDVMKAMTSSISSVLSKVEGTNSLATS